MDRNHQIELAVILAGGMGTRMLNKFGDIPKGFIKIDDIELIDYSYNILIKYGIRKILIGTGYNSFLYEEFSIDKNITCIKNSNFDKTSSFYTLYNMKNYIMEDFLLLESDILYEEKAVAHLLSSQNKDAVLVSGKTYSDDEVFVQVDGSNYLDYLSKDENQLVDIYGELVGISKISYQTFTVLCDWAEKNVDDANKIDYEVALVKIRDQRKIPIEKIENLIWCEIDDENHFNKAVNEIYPQIKSKRNGY
ncbi:MAG: hypothetical protein A2440_06485 [Stygiobacter sp. RIFOXYC2_FULL_38_25]|nr:MAG: hypothetical protein A2440_06485 [Stygiobacter sp. RIFOXYC2_FULL_38_25]OGV17912.1 MAG: hypothetical protein A2237_03280 [Stygiobacter sp. RIFOXYA2_FULL_38_8]OGV79566.1 MAG: hypothetical protein A2X65_18565 [Stygiobacter sp. GWF2_38_21]